MNRLYRSFFEDKNILITGHTGFIGSWLTILLLELGAKIIGYALAPRTENDNYVVSNLEKKIINILADIRDYQKLNDTFKKYKPEIIFHLAAQPLVRKSYLFPKETYDINIGGTINVFELFRNYNFCKVMINFTSDKCYENLEQKKGYKEDDRIGGYDPYSSSKACSELITIAYRNSFFKVNKSEDIKMVSSIRCGNIIGGGDWQEDRLIPDLMKAIKSNKDFYVRNPNSVRPWQFVLEPLRGLLMLTKEMWDGDFKYSDAWNFGPNENDVFTVKQIIDRILNYLKKINYPIKFSNENELHETGFLTLNIDKAKKILGWEPVLNIDESIKFICDWYTKDKIDYDFNVKQINHYFKKVIDK